MAINVNFFHNDALCWKRDTSGSEEEPGIVQCPVFVFCGVLLGFFLIPFVILGAHRKDRIADVVEEYQQGHCEHKN